MSQKGQAWERKLAKVLSRWWTGGENDSVFWRTPNSGGRATARTKSGKKSKNTYGDLLATDPDGQPLVDLVCLELKKGYSTDHIHSLLDMRGGTPLPLYGKWFVKIQETARAAGVPHWMLIAKRDRRESLVFFSLSMWKDLINDAATLPLQLELEGIPSVGGCTLHDFLRWVRPNDVRKALKRHQGRKK